MKPSPRDTLRPHSSIATRPCRRAFLARASALALTSSIGYATVALASPAAQAGYRNVLVLVELKGGNDGLNTLVPYADPAYATLRPTIAIARDVVVQLTDHAGLHPALAPLLPLWESRELAILQGVGYPEPNLSHFRSIEIWDTASRSDEYRHEGWLARAFAAKAVPVAFAADGVVVGTNELGPLAGNGTRTVTLTDTEQFLRRAKLAKAAGAARNPALAHILKVESDIVLSAARLDARQAFTTTFPNGGFGRAVATAAQLIANRAGIAVVRVTLGGFDTHANQPATQARLLGELASGLSALRSALVEIDRWNETLVVTYAEFGRRPKQNQSNGTDHGTASVHFALGGQVAGDMYGEAPGLARLAEDGNLRYALDFRSVYATALERWWGVDSSEVLGGRFRPVPFLRG